MHYPESRQKSHVSENNTLSKCLWALSDGPFLLVTCYSAFFFACILLSDIEFSQLAAFKVALLSFLCALSLQLDSKYATSFAALQFVAVVLTAITLAVYLLYVYSKIGYELYEVVAFVYTNANEKLIVIDILVLSSMIFEYCSGRFRGN